MAKKEDEDEELELIRASSGYMKGLKWLELFLKLTSLRWIKVVLNDGQESNDEQQSSTVTLLVLDDSSSDPPAMLAESRLMRFIWGCRLTRFICQSFVCYMILKVALTAVHHFRYYNLLRLAKSNFNSGSEENVELLVKIIASNKWLQYLGDPYISISGIPMTIYYFSAATPLLLYIVEYFLTEAKRDYVSHLSFLSNPQGERLFMRRKLRQVVDDLIYTKKDLYQSNGYFGPEYHNKTMSFRRRFYTNHVGNTSRSALTKILNDIRQGNLVRPANLTNEWLRKLSKISAMTMAVVAFAWAISVQLNVGLCLVVEWYLRASQRLNSMRWRLSYNSTFKKDGLYDLLELEEEDRWSYSGADGSVLSKIQLALSVEPRYYFTYTRALYLVELFTFNAFLTIWGTVHLHIVLLSSLHKLRWANQIESQLNSCIHLLAATSSTVMRNRNEKGDEAINRMLIISYLNYTHYRNCYGSYKIKASSLLTRMLLLLGLYFLLIYWVALRLEPNFKINIIVNMIGVAFLFNIYLTASSYMLVQSEKIMKAISRLLALGPEEHNKKYLLAISLWHRHLLDTKELKNLFAIRIFGARIDRNFLVTFNAYFIALVILFK